MKQHLLIIMNVGAYRVVIPAFASCNSPAAGYAHPTRRSPFGSARGPADARAHCKAPGGREAGQEGPEGEALGHSCFLPGIAGRSPSPPPLLRYPSQVAKKAAKKKQIKRGVKEVVKALRKGVKG